MYAHVHIKGGFLCTIRVQPSHLSVGVLLEAPINHLAAGNGHVRMLQMSPP